jgi:hypothetical protein
MLFRTQSNPRRCKPQKNHQNVRSFIFLTIVFSELNSKSEGIPKNVVDIAKILEIDKSEGWSDLEKAHGDVGEIIG